MQWRQVTRGDALQRIRRWLEDAPSQWQGYVGAILAGSAALLPDDRVIPPGSDIDVQLIIDGPTSENKPGKIEVGGLLLDVSMWTADELRDLDGVMGHYHLAHTLAHGLVIDDPIGAIGRAQAQTRGEFARPDRIRQRLDGVHAIATERLNGHFASLSLPWAMLQWQFGVGLIPHLMLVAAGKNPTVRRRYAACREVMVAAGESAAYDRLLVLAGYDLVDERQVRCFLDVLERAFDTISPLALESTWQLASDVQPQSRSLAIGGVEQMIDAGDSRESMFWLLATWCRLIDVLDEIGSPVEGEAGIRADFLEAIAGVGVRDRASIAKQAAAAMAELPEYRAIADRIAADQT